MLVNATSPIVLCMYRFVLNVVFIHYYYISFLPARVAANKESVFMLPVCLCEWKLTNVHPIGPTVAILIINFQIILRPSLYVALQTQIIQTNLIHINFVC